MRKILIITILSLFISINVFAMPITYAITVCKGEEEELRKLLKFISKNLDDEDSILIQVDKDNFDQALIDVINLYSTKLPQTQYKITYFPLKGDFASFKNNLLQNAGNNGFLFQLDADEMPSFSLMQNFKYFIAKNSDADIISIPRANYYINTESNPGYTKMYFNESDQLGRFHYPDLQPRIINLSNKEIKYVRKLHEGITGDKKRVIMPHNKFDSSWDLIHIKTMEKQKKADIFYQELEKQ